MTDDLPRPRWLSDEGPELAVAVATRCRLARNVAGLPFPWRAGELARREAARAVLEACERAGGSLGRAVRLEGEALRPDLATRLVEWRYASLDWVRGASHRHLLALPDGSGSLLVNEEDHLRLQGILPGLQVESALEAAEHTDRQLSEHLAYAWDERLGFLTSSPANAGTGMRLSVLLHLPALAAAGTLAEALRAAEEVGCSVRGLYGEGTAGTGWLVQVSNTRTLGLSIREASARVAAAARCLIDAEAGARREVCGSGGGRGDLREAAADAAARLFDGEPAPADLLRIVSVLRLALAEGLLPGRLVDASEWIALAGAAAAGASGAAADERYEAVSRSAAVRQRLRHLVASGGTSP